MNPRKPSEPWWRKLLRGDLPLETETAWLLMVSVLDVVVTYLILRVGGREANPIANWFIRGWGVKGMVYFKFGVTAFVAVLTQIIAQQRPDVARRLLIFATCVVGGVVVYSAFLLVRISAA